MRRVSHSSTLLALIASAMLASACASMQDAASGVKYSLAGADSGQRANLVRGLLEVKKENYPEALGALNRAVWDLEQIERSSLRLAELAEVHQGLADVYSALRKPEWADEERTLAKALAAQAEQDLSAGSPEQALARGKNAYAAARFREADAALRKALIDLEGLTHTPARVKGLEEARCYLTFTFVALDQEERAGEEIRRLRALDPDLAFCREQAPPAIRRLIEEIRSARTP